MPLNYYDLVTAKTNNNKELLNECLKSNDFIEDKLNVIAVLSNYCNYKRRLNLFKEFVERMKKYENINLYIVELIYPNQEYKVTEKNNPMHLQLKSNSLLFHKENMINLGVQKLLPKNWKAMAWIDADIEFLNLNWVSDTLKALNKFDLVHLWNKCEFLDQKNEVSDEFYSYGSKYCSGDYFKNGNGKGYSYWHPGFAWACRREFYDLTNGLYDRGIIGSGDYIMTQLYLKRIANGDKTLEGFESDIKKYGIPLENYEVKIAYVNTTIKHFFHGQRANRKYVERNLILKENCYDPIVHLRYDDNGVLEYTEDVSEKFKNDIRNYFLERNEDEFYENNSEEGKESSSETKNNVGIFSCFKYLFK